MSRSELERSAQADPGDPVRRVRELLAASRVEGASARLAPLESLAAWDALPNAAQDLVIAEVARRLRPYFTLIDTRRYACAGVLHRIAGFRHESSALRFHLLPGSIVPPFPEPAADREQRAAPLLLAQLPLTVSGARRLGLPARGEPLEPATGLSSEAAEAALQRVGLRLPARGEWWMACLAGASTRFSFGERFDPRHVWHAGNAAGCVAPQRHLGDKRWNAFGLVDMIGNVWEWLAGCERWPLSAAGTSFETAWSQDEPSAPLILPRAWEAQPDIGLRPAASVPGFGEAE